MAKHLSAMDIISDSWRLYKNNFDKFVQPIVILALASILVLIPQFFDFSFDVIFYLLALVIYIVTTIWIAVVMYQISDLIQLGKKVNLNSVYSDSFSRSPAYIWIYFLYMLVVFFGLIIIIVPGIIFSVWYYFTIVAVAIEKKQPGVKEAFSSSRKLVHGRWWDTLWRIFAPQLFFTIIIFIISFGIGGIITGGQFDSQVLFNNFYFNLLLNIISAVISPLLVLPVLLLYKNLKTIKTIKLYES